MSVLTAQQVDLDGLDPSYQAAEAGGDEFTPDEDGRLFLHVKNGGASSIDVTIATPTKTGGLDVSDQTVSVPAGGERMIKPAQRHLIEASDGNADISYTDVTSVTVALFRA